MRRLLGVLRARRGAPALAPAAALAAVGALVARARAAGLPVELRVEGEPRPLPAGVDLAAYRVVQEALTNALKHAGPARDRGRASRYRRADLELEVVDRGTARRRTPGDGAGHGLVGMRERVRALRRRARRPARARAAASRRARACRCRRRRRRPRHEHPRADRRRPGARARRLPDDPRRRGRHRGRRRGRRRRCEAVDAAGGCSPTSC